MVVIPGSFYLFHVLCLDGFHFLFNLTFSSSFSFSNLIEIPTSYLVTYR